MLHRPNGWEPKHCQEKYRTFQRVSMEYNQVEKGCEAGANNI